MHPSPDLSSPTYGLFGAEHVWLLACLLGVIGEPALPLADQPVLTAGLDDLAEISCWSTVLLIDPGMWRGNSALAGQGDTPASARLAARREACAWLKVSVRDSAVRNWAEDCSAVTLTLSGPAEAVALARRALGIGGGQ